MTELFGPYEIVKKIATGGMAEVLLAKQTSLGGFERLVCIKRILPHLSAQEDFVAMFQDEARIVANLNHPNVAQIYDIGTFENIYFIAMEYIRGEDLRSVYNQEVNRGNALPCEIAAHVIMGAAHGLDYAHRQTTLDGAPLGIVHRDVNPQNILVTYDGHVKVVDFGVAKAAGKMTHTRSGILKGKYSYMSPEQASGDPIDGRTDIFALGITLYEVTTGTRLFRRDNELETLHAVIACNVKPPSQLLRRYPKDLETIVLKALAYNPDERYLTAGEMARDLERYLVAQNRSPGPSTLGAYMHELFADKLAAEPPLGATQEWHAEQEPAGEEKVSARRRDERRRRSEAATSVGLARYHATDAAAATADHPAATADAAAGTANDHPLFTPWNAEVTAPGALASLGAPTQANQISPLYQARHHNERARSAGTDTPDLAARGAGAVLPQRRPDGRRPVLSPTPQLAQASVARRQVRRWYRLLVAASLAVLAASAYLVATHQPAVPPPLPQPPTAAPAARAPESSASAPQVPAGALAAAPVTTPAATPPTAATPESLEVPAARVAIKAAEAVAATAPPAKNMGRLTVVAPVAVQLTTAKGAQLGEGGLIELALTPGTHAVVITSPSEGFRITRRFKIKPGESHRIEVSPRQGVLEARANVWAWVQIADLPPEETPLTKKLYEGEYRVIVECPDGKRQLHQLRIVPAAKQLLNITCTTPR